MTAEAEVLPAQGQGVLTLVFENPKIAILDEMKARIFIDRVGMISF